MSTKTKLDLVEDSFVLIKQKLPEYLLEHGIDCGNNKKFLCINPDHDDSSPSACVFQHDHGYPVVRCFSCLYVADIFGAANALEGKPLQGPGFLKENVKYLADKYGIEVNIANLTEEELYEIQTYDAYKTAAEYLVATKYSPKCLNEVENRSWNESFLKEYGVSCCLDYHDFRTHLKSKGFSVKFLDEIDLDNQRIFNQDNLIFTIQDENGRPVGFSGRNLDFEVGKDNKSPKFTNTKTTGLRCNIFRKSERLYLMHVAKKHVSASNPLYIVEGYGDALTLHMNGVKNSVAINGLDLNDKQLNLCRRLGVTDLVCVYDADEPGQAKARKLLDEVLGNVHDLRIRFIFLPMNEGKSDPDSFIRANGIQAFLELPKVEPFSWRLAQFISEIEEKNGKISDSDAEHICRIMVGIISNEPSPLKRETMIKELSSNTGYSHQVIKEELDKILSAETLRVQRRKKGVIDSLISDLQTRSDGYEIAIEKAFQDLEDVNKESNQDVYGPEHVLSVVTNIKQYQENESEHRSINFGSNFHTLPVALAGDLTEKFIVVSSCPNAGKTSMFSNLAWNLPNFNENIDTAMFTIDDSAKELIPRIICYDIAKRLYERGDHDLLSTLNISKIAQPFLYKNLPEYPSLIQEREHSYQKLSKMISEGRFSIFDANNGRSVNVMRSIIKKHNNVYRDRKLVFFLDNMYQLESISNAEGRFKYKELSTSIKNLVVTEGITCISTVEINKLPPGQKPTNYNISESGSIEYACNVASHLYSDLHSMRDKSKIYFEEFGNKYPIIEHIVEKNKIAAFKGSIWYKFYADKAFYLEISEEEMMDIKQMNNLDPFSVQVEGRTEFSLSKSFD